MHRYLRKHVVLQLLHSDYSLLSTYTLQQNHETVCSAYSNSRRMIQSICTEEFS